MIPYFSHTTFALGPVTIQVWGCLVALGIALALYIFSARIKRRGGSPAIVFEVSVPILIGGFLGARLAHIIAYEPSFYSHHPFEIFKVWHGGFSSFGGFLGAAGGLLYGLKRQKLSWSEFQATYLDDGFMSFWLGWGIGRIGCFLIHDHPGTLTHFWGAVQYPDGARHDLGLYESILGFILCGICWLLYPRFKKMGHGLLAGASLMAYGLVRFGFDFLRVADVRYAGLTPAQWGLIFVEIALTGWLVSDRFKQRKKE